MIHLRVSRDVITRISISELFGIRRKQSAPYWRAKGLSNSLPGFRASSWSNVFGLSFAAFLDFVTGFILVEVRRVPRPAQWSVLIYDGFVTVVHIVGPCRMKSDDNVASRKDNSLLYHDGASKRSFPFARSQDPTKGGRRGLEEKLP